MLNQMIVIIINYPKNFVNKDINKTLENPQPRHNNIIIINDENIIKLSCSDFYIRIWNFHSRLLLIKTSAYRGLNHICLLDNNYIALSEVLIY